jgi:hypothetical protein
MWKNILAISALILSASVFVESISTAQANQGVLSMGQNPIFSKGGYNGGSQTSHTISAVSGQEIVVTDVSISGQYNQDIEIVFMTSGGAEIGRYKTWNYANYAGSGVINSNMISGLRVPEGEDLLVIVNGAGTFTFSGRYVHP